MTDDEYVRDHPYTGELVAGASCQHMYPGPITGIKSVHGGFDNYEEAEGAICGRQAMDHAHPGKSSAAHPINSHPHHFVPQERSPGVCDYRIDLGGTQICGYPEQLHHWADYDRHMADTAGKVGVGGHTFEGREASGFCEKEECGLDPASPVHRAPLMGVDPGVTTGWAQANRKLGRTSPEAEALEAADNAPLIDVAHEYTDKDRDYLRKSALVRKADAAQYERAPMPDAARRGPVVTLIDAPVDPLGTLAVIGGIYTGKVRRSKAEVTEDERRAMLADMQATVLDGPLESIQFTFLIEGVGRDFTHQAVRNRFSFFAQESLRFAVAEDWAQEIPLPPSLAALPQDAPAVGVWRKALNHAEDAYAALIGAGMPAEEARKVLPHAITTRYYWTVSLRTLLQEAGKRTCTQAQFDWRVVFAGVAKALRERGDAPAEYNVPGAFLPMGDGWQYAAFADLLRPVCYQQGKCGFMAKFDRGCTIRARVDAFAEAGVPSSEWDVDEAGSSLASIHPSEWAADPAAARVVGDA